MHRRNQCYPYAEGLLGASCPTMVVAGSWIPVIIYCCFPSDFNPFFLTSLGHCASLRTIHLAPSDRDTVCRCLAYDSHYAHRIATLSLSGTRRTVIRPSITACPLS